MATGSRNKATLALEALIDGQGEEVVSTIIEEAKNGNMVAATAAVRPLRAAAALITH